MSTISKILLPVTACSLLISGGANAFLNNFNSSQNNCPIISQDCTDWNSILGNLQFGNSGSDLDSFINSIIGSGNNGSNNNNSGNNSGNNNGSGNVDTDTSVPETDGNLSQTQKDYIKQVVSLVNEERAKYGLSALTIDATLQSAAAVRAQEIVSSFSHTRPNGTNFSTIFKEFNISYRKSGENLAWGQNSPEAVVKAWMNSSGHRANILNSNYGKIGVGVYIGSNGTIYWSQLFTN